MTSINRSVDSVVAQETQLSDRVSSTLNTELAALSTDIAYRLAQARYHAIKNDSCQLLWRCPNWQLMGITGCATAMLTLLTTTSLVSTHRDNPDRPTNDILLSNTQDFSAKDKIELYDSLEFLLWLEQERG